MNCLKLTHPCRGLSPLSLASFLWDPHDANERGEELEAIVATESFADYLKSPHKGQTIWAKFCGRHLEPAEGLLPQSS